MNTKQLTAWERVTIARDTNRPKSLDYINNIFTDFIELHGDRLFGDDKSVIGGIALLEDMPVTVIGQQKGKTTAENIERNFGMTNPEGYRKALRLMKQAEKFNRPIITFIDTPGAYPGMGAEERGQGEAIARNLMEMSILKVPTISIIIGEGSSGGALGLGVTDIIIMLENSIYSILSPEGFATILYKDSSKSVEAAEKMKITADELKSLKIIDEIIKESKGQKQNEKENIDYICKNIKKELLKQIKTLSKLSSNELINQRYQKYRKIGGLYNDIKK